MRTRSVAALALALWWLVVNSCLVASTQKALQSMAKNRKRLGRKVHCSHCVCRNRHVKATKRKKRVSRTAAVCWNFGVVSLSASVLAVVLALGDLWSETRELTFAVASAEVRITCGGGTDRGDLKKKKATRTSHYLVATGLALASLLSAAVLLGFVNTSHDRALSYYLASCGGNTSRLNLRKKLHGFLVFGILAVILSAVAFLFYFARLFRAQFNVHLGQWLLRRAELIFHDLSTYLADDDDDDDHLEQEGLVPDAPSPSTDTPEEGGPSCARTTNAQCLV